MATVDLVTTGGITSVAQPVKFRSADLITQAGVASATGRVAWGGSASPLARVPWLPKAGTPLSMDGGRTLNPVWDRALRWLFEQYIGGLDAPTIPQIRQSVTTTQSQVAATTNYAQQVSAYASGIAATADATAAVTQDNGLSGSGSIPRSPPPPPPPGTNAE